MNFKVEDTIENEIYQCPKCDGKGYIAKYRHIKDGICFDCDGTGTLYNLNDQFLEEEPYGSDFDEDDDDYYDNPEDDFFTFKVK